MGCEYKVKEEGGGGVKRGKGKGERERVGGWVIWMD